MANGGLLAGSCLRLTATLFYALTFCCAAIILGIYSYFLAVLSDHHLPIARKWKAVEGISGVAVLYTIAAVVLTCFLGGISFFAFLGITLDVLFVGGFIALAILTRDGASSCNGNVQTPLGNGPSNRNGAGYGQDGFGFGRGETVTYFPRLGYACHLNSAAFAVSIIGAFLFLISAGLQVWVARHHQKEKKYGPSPANNYTSGSGRRNIFRRKKRTAGDFDKEMPTTGTAVNGNGLVTEHGNTAGHNEYYATGPKVEQGGFHNGPTGTAVNPYGYDNTQPQNF